MPPDPSTQLFAFESDFVASLRCIPMAVRFKLDRCAIKLSLRQWSCFTLADRQALLTAPCETQRDVAACRDALIELVAARAGEIAKPLADPPSPAWVEAHLVPAVVCGYARSLGLRAPSTRQWAALSQLQRYALIKLTRDNHDNVNFAPALREFGAYARDARLAAAAERRTAASQLDFNLRSVHMRPTSASAGDMRRLGRVWVSRTKPARRAP